MIKWRRKKAPCYQQITSYIRCAIQSKETFDFYKRYCLARSDTHEGIMADNHQASLVTIQEIRDTGPLSSRNTSKGALVQETFSSVDFLSLAYLYYVLRDRAAFEFVIGPVGCRRAGPQGRG
jgi:hypothetical protein